MNEFKQIIETYLDERAKSDALFAEKYANEKKSVDECCRYIMNEMKTRGNAVFAKDEEVYGLAVHYYDEENIDVGAPIADVRVTAAGSSPKKEKSRKEKQEMAKPIATTKKEKEISQLSLF